MYLYLYIIQLAIISIFIICIRLYVLWPRCHTRIDRIRKRICIFPALVFDAFVGSRRCCLVALTICSVWVSLHVHVHVQCNGAHSIHYCTARRRRVDRPTRCCWGSLLCWYFIANKHVLHGMQTQHTNILDYSFICVMWAGDALSGHPHT